MSVIPFDTLKLARDLRDLAHFTQEQAEGAAAALADAFQDQVATKADIERLESKIESAKQELIIKIGGMLVVAVGALAVLQKVL